MSMEPAIAACSWPQVFKDAACILPCWSGGVFDLSDSAPRSRKMQSREAEYVPLPTAEEDEDQAAMVAAFGPPMRDPELEQLTRELFKLHDLNGNGFLEEKELVQLNVKVALLHHGMDIDREAVKQKYRTLFRTKLNAEGKPVAYPVFRRYVFQVLDGIDRDPPAQEMIVEQFVAEAGSARATFHCASFASEADRSFLSKISFASVADMQKRPSFASWSSEARTVGNLQKSPSMASQSNTACMPTPVASFHSSMSPRVDCLSPRPFAAKQSFSSCSSGGPRLGNLAADRHICVQPPPPHAARYTRGALGGA